jgi:hypothetical protein
MTDSARLMIPGQRGVGVFCSRMISAIDHSSRSTIYPADFALASAIVFLIVHMVYVNRRTLLMRLQQPRGPCRHHIRTSP